MHLFIQYILELSGHVGPLLIQVCLAQAKIFCQTRVDEMGFSAKLSSSRFCGAVLLALTLGRVLYSPCVRRLFRNMTLPGIPDAVAPKYATCSDSDLVQGVSLVVTVKDTCAQAEETADPPLHHLPQGHARLLRLPRHPRLPARRHPERRQQALHALHRGSRRCGRCTNCWLPDGAAPAEDKIMLF